MKRPIRATVGGLLTSAVVLSGAGAFAASPSAAAPAVTSRLSTAGPAVTSRMSTAGPAVPAAARVQSRTATAPSAQPHTIVGTLGIDDYHDNGQVLVVRSGNWFFTYSSSDPGAGQSSPAFQLPFESVEPFALDPDGDIYVSQYPNTLDKLSPSGTIIWSETAPAEISAVFGHQTSSGFDIGAVMKDGQTALYGVDGSSLGLVDVTGQAFSDGPDGRLVAATGDYVVTYNDAYKPIFRFGADGNGDNPPAGQFAFYQQGTAIELADGDYLVADATRGIEYVSAQGVLLGLAPESYIGGLTQLSTMTLVGSTLYYASGPRYSADQQIASLPLSAVIADARRNGPPAIGYGVGVRTATDAFYPDGTKPQATLTFDSWWAALHDVQVRYRVQRLASVDDDPPGRLHTVHVTSADLRNGVDLALASTEPGAYQISLALRVGGHTSTSTIVNYSVGAPGDGLNFAKLPGSADSGGPDGTRGVALARVLGTGADRISLSWSQLLDSNGNLDFSYYDPIVAGAAAESAKTGVPFSVQLTDGGAAMPFIDNGTWGAEVEQIVRHWKSEVHYWEPFNEPNNAMSASDYVNNVLKPTYEAVKAVEPSARVIGGTVVGYDVGYWQQIAADGGLSYMDIAGIHPYPGYDRSFEEQDFSGYIHQIRSIFAAHGKAGMPIWITELAWWSNGTVNITQQADKSARAMLWMRALGIKRWEYFLEQGTWLDGGQDFSAIEGTSWVKPAALALMACRTQLAGRAKTGWVRTGIPQAYDLRFGAGRTGSGTLQALWTDDESIKAGLTATRATTVDVVDEYGRTTRLSLSPHHVTPLALSGSVQYLHVPARAGVHVVPTEDWGSDLALASRGATATATSSNPSSSPGGAIDGDTTTNGGSGFPDGSAWISAPGDKHPALTVTLPRAEVADRAVIATTGIGSVLTGLRNFNVELRHKNGTWTTAARVRGTFFQRLVAVAFRPQRITAVRVKVLRVNYSGYDDGAKPSFWPTDASDLSNPNAVWYGPAIIRELELYGPGSIKAAPSRVHARSKGHAAVVRWNPPPGVRPTEYRIRVGRHSMVSRKTSMMIRRLPAGVKRVRVTAVNPEGNGPTASARVARLK